MNTEDKIRALRAQGVSRSRAAKEIGVTKDILDAMIEAMRLDWPRGVRGGTVEIEGVTDTWAGHSRRLGVTVAALRWRKRQEKDVLVDDSAEAITQEEVAMFVELRKQRVPAKEAATRVGRPCATLHKAAKRDIPSYRKKIVKRVSPEEAHRFVMLCQKGLTTRKAAEEVGRSRARLIQAAKALTIPMVAALPMAPAAANNDDLQADQAVA